MSLIAGVRKAFLFIFVFGVLAPRALAAFAVCQAGWEWVSDPFGFPIPWYPGLPSAVEVTCIICPGFQLETAKPL